MTFFCYRLPKNVEGEATSAALMRTAAKSCDPKLDAFKEGQTSSLIHPSASPTKHRPDDHQWM